MSGPTNNGDAWMYGVIIIEKVITKRKNLTIRTVRVIIGDMYGDWTQTVLFHWPVCIGFFSLWTRWNVWLVTNYTFSLPSMHRGFFSLWTRWNFNPIIMSRSTDGLDGSYVNPLCPSPSVFSSYFNKRNFLANWNHIT